MLSLGRFFLGPGARLLQPSPGVTAPLSPESDSTGASALLTVSPACAPGGMTVMEGQLVL